MSVEGAFVVVFVEGAVVVASVRGTRRCVSRGAVVVASVEGTVVVASVEEQSSLPEMELESTRTHRNSPPP